MLVAGCRCIVQSQLDDIAIKSLVERNSALAFRFADD